MELHNVTYSLLLSGIGPPDTFIRWGSSRKTRMDGLPIVMSENDFLLIVSRTDFCIYYIIKKLDSGIEATVNIFSMQ